MKHGPLPNASVVDVTFGEDHSRMRAGHTAENLAALRHLVRNRLECEQSQPGWSIKGKHLKAGWDNDCLLETLMSL